MTMEPGPGRGSRAEPAVIRGSNAAQARPKRKKARPATSSITESGPIPQPYLALAPKPLSTISRSYSQTLAASNLVLPSSFRRPAIPSSSANVAGTSSGDAGPSTSRNRERERERFANGLLAPPTIRAGGSSTPNAGRRERDRPVSPGNVNASGAGRRRVDRVRGLGAGNPSMTSLGHLGRIMESDPPATIDERGSGTQTPVAVPATRRRRRIVRGDGDGVGGPGVSRRLTVSSREEGRAMGLARGASMRRLNVWDDVAQNDEAPPPFPFPTSSSSRLPPTFESNQSATAALPRSNPTLEPIPNSPPPTFEQATGLAPLLTLPPPEIVPPRSVSRASDASRYESAPSSPVLTAVESASEEEGTEEARADRRMWNADLLAGYSLEERVKRESARKATRETNLQSRTMLQSLPEPDENEGPRTSDDPVEVQPGPEGPDHSTFLREGRAEGPELVATPSANAVDGPVAAESPDDIVPNATAQIPVETAPSIEEITLARVRNELAANASVVVAKGQIPPSTEPRPDESFSAAPDTAASPVLNVVEEQALDKGVMAPTEIGQAKETEMASESPTPTPTPAPALVEPEMYQPTVIPDMRETAPPINESPPDPRAVETKAPEESLMPSRLATPETSTRSLPTLIEGQETESPKAAPSPVVTDTAAETIIPTRKLTRGKAIRRSSSGLIKTSDSPVAAAPLFSAARFDFGKSAPSPSPTDPSPRAFIHRASAPEVHTLSQAPVSVLTKPRLGESGSYIDLRSRGARKSEDRGLVLPGGRRLGDPPLPPKPHYEETMSSGNGKKPEVVEERIPPHREAALLRRESILANLARPRSGIRGHTSTASTSASASASVVSIQPTSTLHSKRASLPSGPLIDFSDFDPEAFSEQSHGSEITGLAATNAELLALLEDEAGLPQSSSQAASTAALVEDLRAQLADTPVQVGGLKGKGKSKSPSPPPPALPPRPTYRAELAQAREEEIEKENLQEAAKRKPPPPPPPLRSRGKGAWTAGQKISIVDTATSPITPRPSIRRPPPSASPSPTEAKRPSAPPPLPTRRPPPPPPRSSVTGTSDGDDGSGRSSIFDKASTVGPLPLPPPTAPLQLWRSPNKPRGPRPRPPPPPPRPRTWARIVSGQGDDQDRKDLPTRPGMGIGNERTQSEQVLSHTLAIDTDSHPGGRDESGRSTSEQNLSAVSGPASASASASGRSRNPRSPEYTDLDVFVSRLEGSGREYEGFSHIAQFLGPAKSPAASQSALSTLLPGPITIESRRTTKEGKVKLKLTLLGVRVTKCPICLAQFREGEMGVLLPGCGHLGHEGCARRWFREDDRCFVCRERLKGGEGVV